jgi:hypothetical protein
MKIMYQMDAPPERPFPIWGTVTQWAFQINPQTTVFIDPLALTEFFQRTSSAQRWAVQAQLAQLTSRKEAFDQKRISPIQQVNTFVLNALHNPRVQGSLQVLGGVAEISAGYGMTFATGMMAAPIGHVVVVHGLDHFTTGLYSVITGKNKNTATNLALQAAGLPPETAGPVDVALSFAGTLKGAKAAAQSAIFPKYKLPPPILTDGYNCVALEEYKVILRAQMEKPYVVNAELQGHVEYLYKPHASIGSGSTAAAIRHELATGEQVFDTFHSQKGRDSIRCLERWLKNNPTASLGDRAAAENIIKDLKDALGE